MNRVLTILAVAVALTVMSVRAESPEEAESAMDKIKMDVRYLYGQSYGDDMEHVRERAMYDLVTQINYIRQEAGKKELKASEVKGIVKELAYSTEDMKAMMVYCLREKALELEGRPQIGAVNAVGTPPLSVGQSPQGASPAGPPQASTQSAQPVPAEVTVAPAPVKPPQTPATPVMTAGSKVLDEISEVLSGQDNWVEIQPLLIQFKKEGKYTRNGTVNSLGAVPDDAYTILMDKNGGILAVLAPVSSGNRINFKTNRIEENINYPNIRIILWFK